LGHRRIAFIGGPERNYDARERLRGFRDAIAAHPGAQGEEYPGDFDEASGHRAGGAILAAKLRPDAVFAANDMMALGCLYAFAQAGVRVPEDIALAGFDDIPLARFVHPSLTTMRVSIAALGERALTRLLAQIEAGAAAGDEGPGGDAGTAQRQVLVPELVVRASSGGPAPRVPARGGRRQGS
ncbi:MAG TPA: substrate-binding domain-containing protein, partial [Pseudoxanthomonas sp.]|nr:substrate-binding domain-containing protein [Pseudoxanthomonas sp.]